MVIIMPPGFTITIKDQLSGRENGEIEKYWENMIFQYLPVAAAVTGSPGQADQQDAGWSQQQADQEDQVDV